MGRGTVVCSGRSGYSTYTSRGAGGVQNKQVVSRLRLMHSAVGPCNFYTKRAPDWPSPAPDDGLVSRSENPRADTEIGRQPLST